MTTEADCPSCLHNGRANTEQPCASCLRAASAIHFESRAEEPKPVSANEAPAAGALGHQEGGGHYKDMAIQPVQFIHANAIGYFEGNVIKYVSRWRAKNGVEDLRKARHYLDLLIELEGQKP